MTKLKNFQNNYNPYYDLYLKNIDKNENHIERLEMNRQNINQFFNAIDEEKYNFAYAPKKWTIAQILQHIIDTERIFCYRALKIVRESEPQIRDYDHEKYAENTNLQSKTTLLEDYNFNRLASVSLFKSFNQYDLEKSVNFGHYKFSVGLIAFIFCGHELHHTKIINSKYLDK